MRQAYLAARGLSEPQGPCVHEGVLDIEVLGVVENGANLAVLCIAAGRRLFLALA